MLSVGFDDNVLRDLLYTASIADYSSSCIQAVGAEVRGIT